MENSGNSEVGFDQGTPLATPYYTPYPKHMVQKSGLQPVNMDLSPSSDGDSSVPSIKEPESGSSSSDSEHESSWSVVHYHGTPGNVDGEEHREVIILKGDFTDPEKQIVDEKIDNILLEEEHRSYDELLKKFIKNEEELRAANCKLHVSEEEIIKLKILIEKSQGELDDARKELQIKENDLEFEKEQVLELQKQMETHVPDCCYKIAKLVEQLEAVNEQLKISNNETHRLQGQLEVTHENMAKLECQLDLGRKQIQDLEDRITLDKANEINHEHQVQSLKAEILDVQAQFSLEKNKLCSDIEGLIKEKEQLSSRLKDCESTNHAFEIKLKEYETEKMKQELHVIEQNILQDEINHLKQELGQRRHDLESVNKEFDCHKHKVDMLMTERDEANAKIDKLMAELSFRDDKIANMEREIFQLHAQHAELISGSETRLNLVNELKVKVEELEKEVTRQNALISDRAEEKREAIRQLCFSLEHYRSGYQELLRAFSGHGHGHRHHAVIAA
ncbi:hypothetical protein SESBI_39927 [Sesbania bispinosa]|nr:hypothetical protein SESBI_39927 [Sesbania bispinosa]